MQAIQIHKCSSKTTRKTGVMPSGWWIAPAALVSLGLWVVIFKLVF